MMVLGGPPHQVTSADAPDVHLTNKSKLGEYLQSTIDSHQSNIRVFLAHLLIDSGRGKVFTAEGNYA